MDEDEKGKVTYLRSHKESFIEHGILQLHHTILLSSILNCQVLVEIYEKHSQEQDLGNLYNVKVLNLPKRLCQS